MYPGWIQGLIKALPLWHAVELVRGLTLGVLDGAMLTHVAYFVVMIGLGLAFTTRAAAGPVPRLTSQHVRQVSGVGLGK